MNFFPEKKKRKNNITGGELTRRSLEMKTGISIRSVPR